MFKFLNTELELHRAKIRSSPSHLFPAAFFSLARADETKIKVGCLPPLTGIEKAEGPLMVNALKLAVKQINATGGVGGKTIELVTEDNQSTPIGASDAYDKLIGREKVVAVVASLKSAQIVAMIPRSNKVTIPTLVGGTNPRLTENNRWIFRTRADDSIAAAAMVQYIAKQTKFKKIGVLNDSGAFGVGGANLVEKNVRELGLTIVKREMFVSGELNFAPYLKRIQDAGAEVLISYVPNYVDQGGIELELKKMNSRMMFLGSPASVSKVALEMAKDAAEGIYAIADSVMGQTEPGRHYFDDYQKEYNAEPDLQYSYAYDSMMILAKTMRAVGTDPEKMRTSILSIKDYHGVLGHYHFSPNGDGLHAVSVVKVENGKAKLEKLIEM